ncbi:calcium-transporting ATPase 12, plasma membrane-type-like [Macadamia integrifolia]|uniref:calcium-transporting ATPase 12, plasma membrane-type-like n=1 Tax=Macadamia integrifolia TaxID=60698 RepID=UPI001C4E4F89|nr:calcium-transporting ATPase 12, plasma membrane-type-like [Macadamia integrifolia]
MSSASASVSATQFDFATNLFLEATTLTLTKPQQRWRLVFKAIYFTRALVSLPIKRNNQILTHLSYSPQQRWRLGFKAICSTQAFLSLLSERKNQILTHLSVSRSISYTALDINDHDYTDSTPFSIIDPKSLVALVKERNLELLDQFGGVHGVAAALNVDCEDGIHGSTEDVTRRFNEFGSNDYQKPPAKGFFHFVLEGFKNFKNTIILILLIRVALSLGLSIKEDGLKHGWYDNGSISLAVFLYIFVSAISNFKKSRQFEKLSRKSNDIRVDVIRDGRRQQISIFDIVVGEIVFLKIGDQIPADGLFLDGHSLKMYKSSMTGENDHVDIINDDNPFMISGAKVADGYCRMLVTSVGINTIWGEMMNSISRETEEQTPLQARLHKLTKYIENATLIVAFIVLVVKLVRYFSGDTQDEKGNRGFCGRTKFYDVMNAMVGIVSAADTIVMVAIPEGLTLAFTLTLVYSMNRMMAEHALLRKLSACETMGSVTTICTDKTGTLTLNQMKVTEFWVGEEAVTDGAFEVIEPNVLQLLQEGVSLNTTGSVYKPNSGAVPEFSGSPTEKAILSWAVLDLGMDVEEVKQSCTVLHVEAFNSEKKRSGVLMTKKGKKGICVHWKGAPEIILALCSSYLGKTGTAKPMNEGERMKFEKIVEGMAAKSLRCIAFAYKPIIEVEEIGNATHKLEEDGLFLLCLVGLKDPCRPKVREAVEVCRKAGVKIKMITGENVFTAKAIAIECGILGADEDLNNGAVVEGVEFRNYSTEERKEKVDTIRVMARSSPRDKLQMVQCLKQRGQIVAVIGIGTNDTPALKEADIGLSMGIQGTEVAKESSDIVILDNNFNSVVTVLKWGRCLHSNIRKLIQFQLTVNAVALVINFVSAVSSDQVPLTAVQLLWVNLIRDTLGTLALATEHPTEELLEMPPVGQTEPFITKVMWRNIIAQALYQVTILLILQFNGEAIFGVEKKIKDTFIFNTFVLCQVYNEFNARKLEKKNIFEGIQKNQMFVGIVGMTLILQVLMVEFMKKYANKERLNWGQWGASIGIAALSWPIGWVFKWVSVSD